MQCVDCGDLQSIGDPFGVGGTVRGPRAPKLKRKIKIRKEGEEKEACPPAEEVGTVLPESQRIFVKTFGCAHNISDSEFMMGLLSEYGYLLTSSVEDSDLVLINSCTVKNPSQDAFLQAVRLAQGAGKPVVVAGCVPQGEPHLKELAEMSVVGVNQIDRVVEVVEQTLRGNKVQLLERNRLPSLDLPKVRRNRLIEILTINTGCLGSCTYCKTVQARGKLGSYTPAVLSARAIASQEEGVREIWMSSEDTGAYGLDLGENISSLLESVIPCLREGTMLRVGMANPPFILRHLEAVARALRHPRVFSFIHVPVQSGSNEVLKRMNRQYTREEFEQVCDYLLAHVPGLTIATDIICGFPGETDEQHQQTLQLLRKYRFRVVNISQFYPRPGTPAARMERVPTRVVKQRSSEVSALFRSFNQRHGYLIGSTQLVSICQTESPKGTPVLVGHTKNYTKVVLPYDAALLGTQLLLRVTSAHPWHVEGQILERSPTLPSVAESAKHATTETAAKPAAPSTPSVQSLKHQLVLAAGMACIAAGIMLL